MISCTALTKQYRRGTDAVTGLTLSVEPGSVFALMGRNGAGKTTTIHLLLDLLRPNAGEARLFGVPSPRLRPQHRQRLGYVSENQHLPGWMQLGEFLKFLRPMYPTWDAALEEKLVKLFAVPLTQKLSQLSRGQRMKAAFLGALCYRPEVLILDEPFSGLDSVIRQDLLDALVDFLCDGQHTVFLSSHDLEEVERLTDTIGVLENGKLALHGKVDDLLDTAREVTFSTAAATRPAGLPNEWWNIVTGPLGSTFTATGVTDAPALAAAVKHHWPDATSLTIRPCGLKRLYVDFLRQSGTESPVPAAA
jgi:ABC-2 type transport system ATP-binding protein